MNGIAFFLLTLRRLRNKTFMNSECYHSVRWMGRWPIRRVGPTKKERRFVTEHFKRMNRQLLASVF